MSHTAATTGARGSHVIDTDPDLAEWEAFVGSTSGDVLTQSSLWGDLKAPGFEAHRVAITRNGSIVAGCQLLSRRVGPVRIAYAANGPLITDDDIALAGTALAGTALAGTALDRADLIDELLDAVLAQAATLRVVALVLQPAREDQAMSRALAARGFSVAPMNVSTPATIAVDLAPSEDELLAAMRSSLRRNIRKAERSGVVVRRGTEQDLATFHRLHSATAARQGFVPMTMTYLKSQHSVLAPIGAFEIYLAELDGEPLAAATVTRFGDRAVFKLAGMSDNPDATKVRPSDYLHWRIIVEAKARGSRYYDFGGFDREVALAMRRGEEPPEEFRAGASQFKLGFGGQPVVLPEAMWRLSPGLLRPAQRPLTWAFHRAAFLRRALARFRSA